MNSKFILSTLYRREYLYTAEDDTLNPTQITFKALSRRQLDFLYNFAKDNVTNFQYLLLKYAIIDITDTVNEHGDTIKISPNDLPKQIKDTLIPTIIEVSKPTDKIYKKMLLNTTIALEPKFQTDTWSCDICRSKGIDKQRNCKFREDLDKHYIKDFEVIAGDTVYNYCPMFYKDRSLIDDMFECYNAYKNGILPDKGSLIDQTYFFKTAVNIITHKVAERDKKQQEQK